MLGTADRMGDIAGLTDAGDKRLRITRRIGAKCLFLWIRGMESKWIATCDISALIGAARERRVPMAVLDVVARETGTPYRHAQVLVHSQQRADTGIAIDRIEVALVR
jgi:hypothetical protein